MNENNGFNNQPEIIEMTQEERKLHKRTFGKLCLSYVVYLLLVQVLVVLASLFLQSYKPEILTDTNYSLIISSVIQYVIAFPIFALIISKIPKHAPSEKSISIKTFIKYLLIAMFIMYVGNYISLMIMTYVEQFIGKAPENTVDTMLNNSNVIVSALIVGIIGPIVEELMFRKIFIDRLNPYGEAVCVFFPALMFGLFHGNLYQFFYAFLIGAVFSYIYVKTGKIIYSTILHIFINLFCGVLPSKILSMINVEELLELVEQGTLTEEYIMANMVPLSLFGIYEFLMLGMIFAGIFTLARNIRNIKFEKGEIRLPKGYGADIMFGNAGAIILVAVCVFLMAYSTFAI